MNWHGMDHETQKEKENQEQCPREKNQSYDDSKRFFIFILVYFYVTDILTFKVKVHINQPGFTGAIGNQI